jgi:hypothetical protein
MKVRREGNREGRKKKKEGKQIGNGVNLPQFRVGVGRRKQHNIGSAWNDLRRVSLLMRPEITKKIC